MSDSEELAEIRERKREALERKLRGEDTADTTATPTTPVTIGSSGEFDGFVSTHDLVLVDFHADWCGPCRMLEPTVERLAHESAAAVAKIDIDAHQGLASQYGVRSVPTLLLFADGEPVERVVGVRDYDSLAALVSQHG